MSYKKIFISFMACLLVAPLSAQDFHTEANAAYCISNLKYGVHHGKQIPAKDFGPIMKKTVEAGAKKMLLKVEGASWSLIRLNEKHARLLLIDPGYVDPQKRDVRISFQTQVPTQAIDILTKKGNNILG